MKITYLGHSCFLLVSEDGMRIVTDPYGAIGFPMPCVGADYVTVSHGHYDHCNVSAVRGNPVVLDGEGSFGCISSVLSWHDDANGTKRGKNLIFHYEIDGMRICHAGDLGERCSAESLKKIGNVDVLLLPVGGTYTIDARQAKEYVDALLPPVVIPMHYKCKGLQVDVHGAEEFLSLFPQEQIERAGSEITLTREALGKRKIIFLERKV